MNESVYFEFKEFEKKLTSDWFDCIDGEELNLNDKIFFL